MRKPRPPILTPHSAVRKSPVTKVGRTSCKSDFFRHRCAKLRHDIRGTCFALEDPSEGDPIGATMRFLIILIINLFVLIPAAQGASLAEIICEEAWLAAAGDESEWVDVRKRLETAELREARQRLPENVVACARQLSPDLEVAEFLRQGRLLLSESAPALLPPTDPELLESVEVPMYGVVEIQLAERAQLPEPKLDKRREEYDRLWADSLDRAHALLPKLTTDIKSLIPKVVSR